MGEELCKMCGRGKSEHSVVGYTVVCKPPQPRSEASLARELKAHLAQLRADGGAVQ